MVEFVVDSKDRWHTITITGDYGTYSYTWSSIGERPFPEFLRGLAFDYVLTKFVGRDDVFDPKATTAAIRQEILKIRRKRETDAGTARVEWALAGFDFREWLDATDLFGDRDAQEYAMYSPGHATQQFTKIYEHFWPSFLRSLT